MSLAAEYGGKVTVGLNRRLNDLSNTVDAAILATKTIDNLYAIELGNEPNCRPPCVSLRIRSSLI
jgi:hypothetical protein